MNIDLWTSISDLLKCIMDPEPYFFISGHTMSFPNRIQKRVVIVGDGGRRGLNIILK